MRTLLKAIRCFLRHQEYVHAPEWDRDDERRLGAFFQTQTGAKLKQTLLNLALRQNSSAVLDSVHLPYKCGYASGFRGCIASIEAMATTTESDEEGSPSHLEHLSP